MKKLMVFLVFGVILVTFASLALADAGIPMKDLVSGTSVGKAGGKVISDLSKHEEDAPDAVDTPIAILPNSEEIVLLQMDGLLTRKEWADVTKMGIKASNVIIALLIVSVLVALISSFYVDLQKNYTQIPLNTTTLNPMVELGQKNITSKVNQTIIGFQTVLAPDSPFDILGGLKASVMGGFETLKVLFEGPTAILETAKNYLYIPEVVITIIALIVFVLIIFILVNLKTGGDN
jgi:hypothetical protein